MKRVTLLLLALVGSTAESRGAGLNLSWDHCYGESAPVVNRFFACDRNDGIETLHASMVLAAPATGTQALELLFDLRTISGSVLPVWWDTHTLSSCRLDQVLVSSGPLPVLAACQPLSSSFFPDVLEIRNNFRLPTPDRMQLVVTLAGAGVVLAEGAEYFLCRLVITHVRTVGAGACAGCAEPVAITFSAAAIRASSGLQTLNAPAGGNLVHWQTSGPTPTRRSSWSALKAMFR